MPTDTERRLDAKIVQAIGELRERYHACTGRLVAHHIEFSQTLISQRIVALRDAGLIEWSEIVPGRPVPGSLRLTDKARANGHAAWAEPALPELSGQPLAPVPLPPPSGPPADPPAELTTKEQRRIERAAANIVIDPELIAMAQRQAEQAKQEPPPAPHKKRGSKVTNEPKRPKPPRTEEQIAADREKMRKVREAQKAKKAAANA